MAKKNKNIGKIIFEDPKGAPVIIHIKSINSEGKVDYEMEKDESLPLEKYDHINNILAQVFANILDQAKLTLMSEEEMEKQRLLQQSNILGGPQGEA